QQNDDSAPEAKQPREIVNEHRYYPNGKPHAVWLAKIASDGRYLRHGKETWFYSDGRKQWEANYEDGRKSGAETYWSSEGEVEWQWQHAPAGLNGWTQFWPNGKKKSESSWIEGRCTGVASLWDPEGRKLSERKFKNGVMEAGLAWSVKAQLCKGDQMYSDRKYKFTAIPDYLLGQEWIQPANDSSETHASPTATFRV